MRRAPFVGEPHQAAADVHVENVMAQVLPPVVPVSAARLNTSPEIVILLVAAYVAFGRQFETILFIQRFEDFIKLDTFRVTGQTCSGYTHPTVVVPNTYHSFDAIETNRLWASNIVVQRSVEGASSRL